MDRSICGLQAALISGIRKLSSVNGVKTTARCLFTELQGWVGVAWVIANRYGGGGGGGM